MANARNKAIDNTHLSIDQAETRGFIHRDYIAHCLRWSHVAKYLNEQQRYKTHHVLDVGCGRDQPLPRLMYTSRLIPQTGSYTGVDYNKLTPHEMFHTGKFPATFIGGVAFPDVILPRELYDTITCFEVMEHVEPAHALLMLEGIHKRLTHCGTAFISTPCYDEKTGAAANHVNEMSYTAFGAMLERAGFRIVNVWGTFASQKDYKPFLTGSQRELFGALSNYYDSNYLATIFAPLFPEHSRNCLWRVQHADLDRTYKFLRTNDLQLEHHSSSALWPAFARKELV